MFRSALILAVFAFFSFFFTQKSLHFPVLHFLLTPFWTLPFFYWWSKSERKICLTGFLIFSGWQIYFAIKTGILGVLELWILCVAILSVFSLVHQMFEARIRKRRSEVADKNRELESIQKKYESRRQSLEHLERQVTSLLNLFEIARELSEAIDFSALAENLSKTLMHEFAVQKIFLWIPIRNREEGKLLFRVIDIKRNAEPSIQIATCDEALIQQMISKRQMIRNQGVWYFPAFDQNELYAVFGTEEADEKDLAKMEVLSSFLALLVKKISLYETIRELSILDDLTQVFVRRHFMERLKEEIKRSQRFKAPLSLLMLDIDHFKRYNDDFGHLVGDATLKKVAEILKINVRRVDLVGRYGGEEFVVVMPETRHKEALEVAERIRSYVARHTFKLYHVETKVTVSQGIATYDPLQSKLPEDADPTVIADALIQAADKCLYQAKEDGRNRVMVCKEWV